jgi:eukaryotic-like serine/threonine-protein kinase
MASTEKEPGVGNPPAAETATVLPGAPQTIETLRSRPEIAGYEILGELGRGGMGVVYKARHRTLNRVVALKMILAGGHAGEHELARFRSEAQAVARLQHPNIVQIYEVGDAGQPYFSLEFCEGGSLAQKLTGSPLPPMRAAELVELLARAMDTAHRAGVVHRDLKPANILLTVDGTPKVTDFGLAKRLDAGGNTASGTVMGTPSYMAPEQAGGKGKTVGPAADVYALGAILYELLTGRPPFRAATPLETILQVVTDDPAPPRQLNAGVPRDLEAICLKCLQKDPARRYSSAAELVGDLTRFHSGEPVVAQQSGLLDRLTGALDRVQLQSEFAVYGSLMLWLAPLMLLPELWIMTVVRNNWPSELLALGQFARVIGFLSVVGYHRGWQWRPRGAAERQLWAVWGGYLLACFVLGLSGRIAFGLRDTGFEVQLYQGLTVLAGLAFFALAATLWGYCAVIGLAFLGLAFVMAVDLSWAPLEFGLAWAAVLVYLGIRLRRLGAAVRTDGVAQ